MKERTPIDICIVSGSRPLLLDAMLKSFYENLFVNFKIRNVFVNVDLFMGDRDDQDECVNLIKEFFPEAKISTPPAPSFGAAVKRLWLDTGDAPTLHLEDDWTLNQKVTDSVLDHFLDEEDLGMLVFSMDKHKHGVAPEYLTRRKEISVFGQRVPLPLWRVNAFGTSPRFFRSGLTKCFSRELISDLDPEKQVFRGKNRKLSKLHQKWRSKLLWSDDGSSLISDIGTAYRERRGYKKIQVSGRSVWIQEGQDS